MLYLKQSTACTVQLGPFVDNTDGFTALAALTVNQAAVKLSKNGGNIAQKNDATAATYDEVGMYSCPLNTTDTNTLGTLQIIVLDALALPVFHDYMVVTANVYDTLCSTDNFDVEVATKTGFALSAAGIDAILDEDATAHTTANSVGENLNVINDMLTGKFVNSGTTMTHYKQDGVTARKVFTKDSASNPTTRTPV